jgi:Mn-dependent DtxR family transcriptional regulator
MRSAKLPKLDDLMKKLSDEQLVDFTEKTVKEGDELQHTPSLVTLERLVELYEKCKACVDELERAAKST